jgi:transposase
VTISTIHQRLRDDHGMAASESSLRRYLAANFAEEVARSAVTVLRDTPPAREGRSRWWPGPSRPRRPRSAGGADGCAAPS